MMNIGQAKSLNTPHTWGTMPPEFCIKSAKLKTAPFDWEGIESPNHSWNNLVIYELHVRAFTQHASSGVKHPGTFLGLIEKIPYLKDLGITAVELMPIFEFDERKGPPGLSNFWGYDPVSFFCPMNRYGVSDTVYELKLLIKEMHRAGLEVILDVVYNHSSSFYADKAGYYLLSKDGEHTNYSGCGNTLNANAPKMRSLILESLRYFCTEFHVDGFRFDLAATMTRGGFGTIEAITNDPVIGKKKLIAEPWDPGGLYLLGKFPKGWGEWNDTFRDHVRQAVNFGNISPVTAVDRSINFAVCHDGFTLMDLVSYEQKYNEANQEGNQDGADVNYSANCGVEGTSDEPQVVSKRFERMRQMTEMLFSAPGIPMWFMGDEYGHTRYGNNNAWCQDNETNWFLWDRQEENRDWFDFVKGCILKRKGESI